jgi:hypothetical protein
LFYHKILYIWSNSMTIPKLAFPTRGGVEQYIQLVSIVKD